MFGCLYSQNDSIYTFAELAFPSSGIHFQHYGKDCCRPYVAFNMVASVDGKTTTHHGELTGLGSRTDRQLMQRLRSQVDGVLTGGHTLRVDPFIPTVPPELAAERSLHFPNQPQPLGIVVSNSGDLPTEHRFWEAGRDLRLVFLGEAATQEAEAKLAAKAMICRVATDPTTGSSDLGAMLDILFRDFGIKRLLVEGGASLNYALISQGWGDELFLTVSPCLVGGIQNASILGGAGYGMGGKQLPKLKLRSLYHHEEELFFRYQIS